MRWKSSGCAVQGTSSLSDEEYALLLPESGLELSRNLVDLDGWEGELQGVKEAEASVQRDSDRYNTSQSKSFLGILYGQAAPGYPW